MFLLKEEVLPKGNEGKEGRREYLLENKKFTSTSCSVSLKITITDILSMVFSHDKGDTVGTV